MRCCCGHDRAQHIERLPAPCAAGWSLTLQSEAMQAALDEGRCPLAALAEETRRQRATGACECIAFAEEPSAIVGVACG